MKVVDRELRDLTLEHDLLLQASEKVIVSSPASIHDVDGVTMSASRRCSRSATSC